MSRIVPSAPTWRLMEGYHSPQVDVAVRLNTNESPVPPPARRSWRTPGPAAMADIDWHRYPDRGAGDLRAAIAAHHGVAPEQVFAANGSNEVLQTLLLTYGGPGTHALVTSSPPTPCTATSPASPAPPWSRASATPTSRLDPAEVAGRRRAAPAGGHVPVLAQQPHRHWSSRTSWWPSRARTARRRGRRLLVVDEAYGQFAPWSALELVDDDRPLVVTRTYSKTWSMAAARLGLLVGPAWVVAELDKVVLPYHLDAVKQLAGTLALDYEAEMDGTGSPRWSPSGGGCWPALAELPVDGVASGANFVLFRPDEPGRRARCGEAWSTARCSCELLVRGLASTAACGSPSAPPTRTTPSSPPWRQILA